jgi:hypothetical protein
MISPYWQERIEREYEGKLEEGRTQNIKSTHSNSPKEVKCKVPGNADSNHVEHVGASEGDSSFVHNASCGGKDGKD